MTVEHADICIKLYVTPELYLGLRHRAAEQDRTLSQHLRHLIRLDLHQACVSRSRYVAFADSGVAFNTSMLQVSADARRVTIDRSSERLLARMQGRSQSERAAKLSEANRLDLDKAGALQEFDQTSRLMKDYFDALKKLASTDAPAQVQAEVSTAATNLTKFVQTAQTGDGPKIAAGSAAFSAAAGGLAGLAVDAALRRELDARAETLDAAFALQEDALERVATIARKDAEDAAADRAERLVTRPYVAGQLVSASAQNAWIEDRSKALLVHQKIAAIGESQDAMKQMRENFMKLRSGDITAADLDAFTAQLGVLIGLLRTI